MPGQQQVFVLIYDGLDYLERLLRNDWLGGIRAGP